MVRKEIVGIILFVMVIGVIPLFPAVFPEIYPVSASQSKMDRFHSYQQLVDFVDSSRYLPPIYVYGLWRETFLAVSPNFDSASAPEHSTTNIQVAGVDEADIVKCDGDYIYLVSDGKVFIVKAYPPEEAMVVARIEVNGTVRGIFVNGDRLVILMQPNLVYEADQCYVAPIRYWWSEVAVKVYDIADRSEPVLARNVTLEGSYLNSRMIGDYVYVLATANAYIQDGVVPLPYLLIDGCVEAISATSIYYSNASDYSYAFTTVLAINVKNDEEPAAHETFLFGSAGSIYVSLNNVYLVSPRYGDGQSKTAIHRIHIAGANVTCEASGEVPGYVLNQFSLDEYNGYFRIATTVGQVARISSEATSSNNVYVLNASLSIVGRLEDLAPGEKIYSARFMGERCYLVTFKKIDPLFVIGLANPYEPEVLGKLKIPGYSDYLHPYDENHLIGIGKNTVDAEEGNFAWYQGVKVSLFDVSDVESPKEVASFTIGDRGTDSPVLRDPKALLFDKERGLLVMPVLVAKIDQTKYPNGVPPNAYGDYVWQGAYVFNITESNIALRGKITHMENQTDLLKSGYYFYSNYSIERALYIDNVLYTISAEKIKANSLVDLSQISEVELP